jgi:hypothetical protein
MMKNEFKRIMAEKKIPFDFILDYLHPLQIEVRQMFGTHTIYANNRILLALRQKNEHKDSNGIWVATGKEHHPSLRKEFPSMHSIPILMGRNGETGWQMIPADADDFEESVLQLCRLIVRGDPRIGKLPRPRKR